MGKPPKKKNLADKVRKTKTSAQIKNNPFEVKINRKKFDVLGRKSKHDVGLPGVSRSKAINKRKETLLKEFRLKNKANKLIDRRFGEYDTKMAPEDKILKRFTLERQRTQARKDLYNLNEDEELTHYGQSLAEIEKLTDAVDSESDSEEKGLLSAELTAAHFGGGGLLRKKPSEDDDDGKEGREKPKTRQELIEELILKSKQEKRERQAQKEEAQELTEKLDQEWRSIQRLMAHKASRAEGSEEPLQPKLDDYDVMVRELGFEMKAQPSEKLKTAEELAREERERLQRLEADRQKRMLGDVGETTQAPSHLSADDLNDGFILDKDDRKTLSYQDGKWNVQEGEDEEGVKDSHEDDAEGDDEKDDDEEDEEEEEGVEGLSDLDSEQGSGADDEEEDGGEEDGAEQTPAKDEVVSQEERKVMQEAARAELPYTFKAPESYTDLKAMLQGHTSEQQCLIVERTQKCHHPSLAVGNKTKLQKLFGFLLEYVGELATQSPPELTTINALIPQIYSLCQLFPDATCKEMQTLLSDNAHSMEETIEVKGRAAFPGLDMLVYLKIVALLFPTSDFRHPVTTPAFLYISQALTKCPVVSLEGTLSGLLLCCLAVEFVSLSRRFIPELINFLLGLLHLAVPSDPCAGYRVVPPFRQQGKARELLLVRDPEASYSWRKKPLPLTLTNILTELQRDHYRLSVLHTCLDLVKRCTALYRELPSYQQIFQPIRTLLAKHLPVEGYPTPLQVLHREILEDLPESPSQHAPLVFEKKKPIPLKLLEPKIVEVLDYGKKRGSTKEEKERERLKHKYKREFKGALREIRKDTRFLAQTKLSDIMSRDAERKRKVKELYGSLATQEGEWKALKRKTQK
ncbi:nucleolar protein 14 [Electrophorus electricus]|uniref:Nucleolar protein 14 n=1 Tax=Electrophorus electricus TaxID=8005 RepID=A0A4W4DPC1_ELEEL|nr:nucleolar protein 14 [Electrophorus electricus]XP_035377307.1 nucleolar protein 14 [Electrophorus electricus]